MIRTSPKTSASIYQRLARRFYAVCTGIAMTLPAQAQSTLQLADSQPMPAASLPRMNESASLQKTTQWDRDTLLGNWAGLRPLLVDYGISFTLNQTSDYAGNTRGGIKQGFSYDGLLDLEVDANLQTLLGWQGTSAHIGAYAMQGVDLNAANIGSIMTTSNVEATPSVTKLGEVWIQQKLFADTLAVRLGQLEADKTLMVTPTASVFINSTFGMPDSIDVNMPGSGPVYPNAAPGGLLTYTPDERWTLQLALFNGNPMGPGSNANIYGTDFFVGQGTLTWLEVAYATTLQSEEQSLPGYIKAGAYNLSGPVHNLTSVNTGRNFSNPSTALYHNQYSIYGLIDQALWREAGSEDQGLNGFFRMVFSPQIDRNMVTAYGDAGLSYTGLFSGRPKDVLAVGYAWANISPYLSSAVQQQNTQTGTATPNPTAESLIEVTYQAPLSPWLTLQPFFQYVANPGGKAPMPNNPNQAIPSATVIGVRANISF